MKANVDELHGIPRWFAMLISKAMKKGLLEKRRLWSNSSAAFFEAIQNCHYDAIHFWDHFGRNGKVFYTEPYMTKERAEELASRFANMLGCEYRFAESRWKPPHTVRVEFFTQDSK